MDSAGTGLVECIMAKTFREWNVQQQMLLPPSVLDFVPPGHLAHFVRDTVAEELDLSAIVDTYEEERGYPPYHPVMMTKSDPIFLDISPANGGMSTNQGGRDESEAPEGEAGEW
jgi:hypothetical protein